MKMGIQDPHFPGRIGTRVPILPGKWGPGVPILGGPYFHVTPVAFHTHTEFFTHAGHICYFLQSQLWQERTENVISRLSDSSKVLDAKQDKALNNQDKILDQDQKIAESLHKTSEQMNEAFTDMRVMAEKQRQLLSEVFGTLQRSVESVRYLMSLFLVEFVGCETFAFFIVYWLVILLLPWFGYSGAKLHLVLFTNLAVEIVFRRIYGYFMFGEIKPPPETLVSKVNTYTNVRHAYVIQTDLHVQCICTSHDCK